MSRACAESKKTTSTRRPTARIVIGAIAILVGLAGQARAADSDEAAAAHEPAKGLQYPDDAAEDAAYARRLNRARAEHEARRAETAARLEAEQARQREMGRLQGSVSGHARRQSYLQHELHWTQRELDSITRDPADVSAIARRGGVERELRDVRSQYETTNLLQQGATRQLDALRVR